MSRTGPGGGHGGVSCPECGFRAPFREFSRSEECPECETSLGRLVGVDARRAER